MPKIDLDKSLPPALWELPPKPSGGIRLGTEMSTQFPIWAAPKQLGTHMHVIGGTGTGKSYFLEALIEQLIQQGHGLCLIDPHGDLYHRVLSFCVYADSLKPDLRLAERVIPFDVAERRQILGFNPMRRRADGMETPAQAKAMMETVRKCWGQTSFDATPRLGRWLYNIFSALIEADQTFVQAYNLVNPADNPYRPAIIAKVTRPTVRAEWEVFSQLRLKDREERLESSLNRIKPFIEQPAIRRVIGQHTNTLDFNVVMNKNRILLVNLNRQNVISEDDQNLLGALLINELLITAFARPRADRTPFFLICDEFEKFVTRDMSEILDGGRKFGLHLILAHQHLRQLKEGDSQVYNSTLTNARTKVVFGGLSEEDLDIVAKEIFTGELDPNEIKDEIEQTKIDYVESTREVRSTSESHGSSDSSSDSRSDSWTDGRGDTYTDGLWFVDEPSSHSRTYSSGSSQSTGSQTSTSYSSGSSRTIVPFLEPHEYKELTSREFRSLDEQLYIKKAILKRLPTQHYALLLPGQQVQFVKSPTYAPQFQNDFPITSEQKDAFLKTCFEKAGCFKSPEAVDREIAQMEERLLRDYEVSLSAASEDAPLIEQNDRALVNKAAPAANPPALATTPGRPSPKNRKKKTNTAAGEKKKDDNQPGLPTLDITDNPMSGED